MAHSASPLQRLAFGVFSVDVNAGELRKHGVRIKVQQLPFQLLVALIENQGQIVTREELRSRLWPNDTFVDFDHGISSAINKLRGVLNDSARHPHYIETVGRRGYRFIYPVTMAPVLPAAPMLPVLPLATEAKPVVTPPAANSRRRVIALASVAVVLLVSVLMFTRRESGWNARDVAIHSLVVLPLANLSSDPEQEYFSEGLTDELITRLAAVEGLRVISRTSSMQFKGSKKPLREIAKELHVDGVVEGSVLRADGRIRITVQLVEAADDRHVWARSYERDNRDILALQNDVTRDIAENIHLNLDPSSRQRQLASHQINPEAHEAYLRGRFYWSKRTVTDFKTAIHYFDQAIALEPDYALAYTGLADCYALLGAYTLGPQDAYIPKARAAALKALELDDQLAETHTALAVIAQNYDWDWQTAEKEYRRAIELDPNNATAHHWYGEFLSFQGRFDQALSEADRARQLDPLSLIIQTDRAVILYYARQYDASVAQFMAVKERAPEFPRVHMINSPLIERGRYAEAFADIQAWHDKEVSPWRLAALAYTYGRSGEKKKAQDILHQLQRMDRQSQMDPGPLVSASLGAGDKNLTFAMLERAFQQHSTALCSLKVNPAYDPLRSDPRFNQLLARVGFTPTASKAQP